MSELDVITQILKILENTVSQLHALMKAIKQMEYEDTEAYKVDIKSKQN